DWRENGEGRDDHGGGADLGGAVDGERRPQKMRQEPHPARDGGGEKDDRRRAGEGELEAHVPGQVWMPAQHRGRGEGEGGPNMRRTAEVRGGDGKAAHRRRADGGGGGAADQRV